MIRSRRLSPTCRARRAISTSWLTRSKNFLQVHVHDDRHGLLSTYCLGLGKRVVSAPTRPESKAGVRERRDRTSARGLAESLAAPGGPPPLECPIVALRRPAWEFPPHAPVAAGRTHRAATRSAPPCARRARDAVRRRSSRRRPRVPCSPSPAYRLGSGCLELTDPLHQLSRQGSLSGPTPWTLATPRTLQFRLPPSPVAVAQGCSAGSSKRVR